MYFRAKFRTFRDLYKMLYSKYQLQNLGLIFLSVTNGFFGSLGIIVVVPLLSLVIKDAGAENNAASRAVYGLFVFFGLEPSIKLLLILIVSIFLFKALALFLYGYISARINANISNHLRRDFFSKTLATKWTYLVKQKISYLEYSLMGDLNELVTLNHHITHAILNFTTFLAYLGTAFALSWFITASSLLFGIIILLLGKLATKRLRSYSNRISLIKRSLMHHINESVLGLKSIKAMGAETNAIAVLDGIQDQTKSIILANTVTKNAMGNPIEPLVVLFISGLFAYAYKTPDFHLVSFIVTVYLVQRIFIYVQQVQGFFQKMNETIPCVHRIIKLERELYENKEVNFGGDNFKFENALEFKNATFSYGASAPVLHEISFKIQKGSTVGIIGPSGAGKTTIADMFLRLLEPQSGQILIDGADIKNISYLNWRRNIGYVSQDIFLKDGTARDNIKFYNENITDEAIFAAARAANIYDFVSGLPKGFDTKVGDRGLLISGGQRQRIVLARAFARQPSILVLDEATSSLDSESEASIKEALEKMKRKLTIIIIAHRLSTVIGVDKIIALKDGKIAEEGSPTELLQRSGSYFKQIYSMSQKITA